MLPNLICIALHEFLIALQVGFLASLPIFVIVPVGIAAIYVAGVMVVNTAVCWLLNGSEPFLEDTMDLGKIVRGLRTNVGCISMEYVFYF